MSYPGRCYDLPIASAGAFAIIGEMLLDLETSFYTPDPALHALLLQTGARALPPSVARYQFYPTLTEATLERLSLAPVGDLVSPDQSATLVIAGQFDAGTRYRLHGPGIAAAVELRLAGIPPAFWRQRASVRYPLGWDVIVVDGSQVLGIPRTTNVEW